jgi:methionyl-tRNA formyltransferase
MRIGVAATPEVAIPTLNWLSQSEHVIELIITQPDRPSGRGRNLQQSVVADWAESHNIPVLKPESSRDLIGRIEQLDLVLTIAYGVILPESILRLPKNGFLNLHFSLLPSYRGAAPVQRTLQNGDTTSGVTVFQLDKGMDTGPIFAQESIVIDPKWRSFELLQQLAALGPTVVERSFDMIASGQSPKAQNGLTSIAAKISKAEAKLDFDQSSQVLVNNIRAFTYAPGAWTTWKNEPFKICAANVSESMPLAPGEIVVKSDAVLVGTQSGVIEILRVIPAGKKEMNGIDWARGAHLMGGEFFG